MKNIITIFISVITSVLIGMSFMDITEETIEPTANITNSLIALQIGAYKEEASAKEIAEKNNAITVKGENYYYVYAAVLSDTSNIERMMNELDENNTYYYAKELKPNTLYQQELIKYEELMRKCTSDVAFLKLVEQSLKKYEVYNEN